MKKQQVKRIVLSRETLQQLSGERLGEIAGGFTDNNFSICVATCKMCQFSDACPTNNC
jgi:hypothetical protein